MNYRSAHARRTIARVGRLLFALRLAMLVGVTLVQHVSADDEVTTSEPPAAADGSERTASWPPWRLPHAPHGVAPSRPDTPHPAVARIIVPEHGATAYGSGTLVDVRDQFGLVVTNWHVVRDASGPVQVVFPGGFRSQARPLKVDRDWDLAALVVWRPPLEPVPLAERPPRPGDVLTIHGYGQGDYRIATGRCTTYYAPKIDFPQEMVELDVEARQGDSGGPIFNSRGELAGVLFGAGQGTTIGSFGPRVESFLATLAPDIGQPNSEQIAVADRPAPRVHPRGRQESGGESRVESREKPRAGRESLASVNRAGETPAWSAGGNAQPVRAAIGEPITWQDVAESDWFEFLKSLLAVIGLAAVVLQLVRIVR